jgi:glycosyltransferase involved in cell wall biosynthesis
MRCGSLGAVSTRQKGERATEGFSARQQDSFERGAGELTQARITVGQQPTSELDILILAPVPPPFGGVAVHVGRLVPMLERAGLRVGVLNHFSSTEMPFVLGALKRNPLNYYRLPRKFPALILHYHHARWSTLMAVAIGKRASRTRYVLTIHSGGLRQQLSSKVPFVRRATSWALRRFDAIIVVNPGIRSLVRDHVGRLQIEVLPAFLAADGDEPKYNASVEEFFSSGRTLLVPSYRVHFSRGGFDTYGLDTAVEAFISLAEEYPELKLAVFIANEPSRGKARRYLSALEERIARAGFSDRVLVAFGLPLSRAFRHNVVIVRPTRTEGDALSVREALHAGVPVVASDVVERPAGTVTFGRDNVPELCAALRWILEEPVAKSERDARGAADETTAESFLDRLMRIYRTQLSHAR